MRSKQLDLFLLDQAVHAIEMMGDKITSKKIAQEAGVSVVPGSNGAISDIQKAKAECIKIGYPVMVKASSGGGGKGMRVVEREEDLELSMQAAMNEARSSLEMIEFLLKNLCSNRDILKFK